VAFLAGTDRADRYSHAVAVQIGFLLGDADQHQHRTFRHGFGIPDPLTGLERLGWRIGRHDLRCGLRVQGRQGKGQSSGEQDFFHDKVLGQWNQKIRQNTALR
jgi:hypothetical protein